MIDPSVASDVYRALADEHGWSIRYVLDTHVHADHVSRARELANHTGATLLLPPQDRVAFPFTPFAEGARVIVGTAVMTALHTPGHSGYEDAWFFRRLFKRRTGVAPARYRRIFRPIHRGHRTVTREPQPA